MEALRLHTNGESALRRTLVSTNKIYEVTHHCEVFLVQRLYDVNGKWDSTVFKRASDGARGPQWYAFDPDHKLYDLLLKKCID